MLALQRWISLRNAMLATSAVTALAQASCQDGVGSALGSLPATSPAQGYASYGPYTGEGPIPIGYPRSTQDVWAWPERTYALDRVFYDTRPDYGFDYGGSRPLAWETADDWTMYADPHEQGRYYYYEPNAQTPYYIRDDQYGYGFDDTGRLVAMFNLLGQLMPNSFLGNQAPVAADYYRRAYDMRHYGLRAQPVAVTDTIWLERQPLIVSDFNPWLRAAQAEPWVEYRTRTDGRLIKAFEKELKHRKHHLGFPAHAKGWGPPFLRDGDRRVVIAGVTDPGVVVVERDRVRIDDRDRVRIDDRAARPEERGRDDRGRSDDRAPRGDDRDRGRKDDNPGRGHDRADRGPDGQDGDRGKGKGRDEQRADRGPGGGDNGKGGGNGNGKGKGKDG